MGDKREAQMKEILVHMAGEFLARESSKQSLITVTRAEMTPDLKMATIFLSVFPEAKEVVALAFCKRERSAFREYLRAKSSLHFPPTIDFEIDIGEKNRQKIGDLLKR
ncbi:ribosome-binding factor A [Candidatus Kaiserbacteria bacterium]|nr:ribosome-binding factor A [Candidatus Kaiserbacteria bacterium]